MRGGNIFKTSYIVESNRVLSLRTSTLVSTRVGFKS